MSHPPTKSELRAMLEDAGLMVNKRLGQHFLVDGNLMRLLVSEANLGREDCVLEVGAAVGNLTELLALQSGWVVAVEIDPALAHIARRRLAEFENIDFVVTDILADKHHVAGTILEILRARQQKLGGAVKLVANLPYAAATPLVAELVMQERPPERLVFTVQEEVAARLAARPATREYGPVGVLVQALAEVEMLRALSPGVFWPPPKVNSMMVRLRPRLVLRKRIGDLAIFRRTIEGLFAHRRKRAARSLALADPQERTPDFWAARLKAAGLDPEARGETYSVEEIIRLANLIFTEEHMGRSMRQC